MNEDERAVWAAALKLATDNVIRTPLWLFRPAVRPLVIHERRVRFQNVDEEIGDPEYG